jgi:UDP-3-O-[3-hydroxymyristoyl] glucosamine N-acyltransferase
MRRIVVPGAGGHAHVVVDTLQAMTLVDVGGVLSPTRATVGEGSVILPQAVLNATSRVGRNTTIVNTSATVDHHAVVGDHAHVATGDVPDFSRIERA